MRNIYLAWEATVSATLHMAKQVSNFVVSTSFHKGSVNLLVTVHPHQHLELSNNFPRLFVALIFGSLITNAIDHFLMRLLVFWFLLRNAYICLLPVFVLNCFSSLYVQDSNFLSVMWIAHMFSQSLV